MSSNLGQHDFSLEDISFLINSLKETDLSQWELPKTFIGYQERVTNVLLEVIKTHPEVLWESAGENKVSVSKLFLDIAKSRFDWCSSLDFYVLLRKCFVEATHSSQVKDKPGKLLLDILSPHDTPEINLGEGVTSDNHIFMLKNAPLSLLFSEENSSLTSQQQVIKAVFDFSDEAESKYLFKHLFSRSDFKDVTFKDLPSKFYSLFNDYQKIYHFVDQLKVLPSLNDNVEPGVSLHQVFSGIFESRGLVNSHEKDELFKRIGYIPTSNSFAVSNFPSSSHKSIAKKEIKLMFDYVLSEGGDWLQAPKSYLDVSLLRLIAKKSPDDFLERLIKDIDDPQKNVVDALLYKNKGGISLIKVLLSSRNESFTHKLKQVLIESGRFTEIDFKLDVSDIFKKNSLENSHQMFLIADGFRVFENSMHSLSDNERLIFIDNLYSFIEVMRHSYKLQELAIDWECFSTSMRLKELIGENETLFFRKYVLSIYDPNSTRDDALFSTSVKPSNTIGLDVLKVHLKSIYNPSSLEKILIDFLDVKGNAEVSEKLFQVEIKPETIAKIVFNKSVGVLSEVNSGLLSKAEKLIEKDPSFLLENRSDKETWLQHYVHSGFFSFAEVDLSLLSEVLDKRKNSFDFIKVFLDKKDDFYHFCNVSGTLFPLGKVGVLKSIVSHLPACTWVDGFAFDETTANQLVSTIVKSDLSKKDSFSLLGLLDNNMSLYSQNYSFSSYDIDSACVEDWELLSKSSLSFNANLLDNQELAASVAFLKNPSLLRSVGFNSFQTKEMLFLSDLFEECNNINALPNSTVKTNIINLLKSSDTWFYQDEKGVSSLMYLAALQPALLSSISQKLSKEENKIFKKALHLLDNSGNGISDYYAIRSKKITETQSSAIRDLFSRNEIYLNLPSLSILRFLGGYESASKNTVVSHCMNSGRDNFLIELGKTTVRADEQLKYEVLSSFIDNMKTNSNSGFFKDKYWKVLDKALCVGRREWFDFFVAVKSLLKGDNEDVKRYSEEHSLLSSVVFTDPILNDAFLNKVNGFLEPASNFESSFFGSKIIEILKRPIVEGVLKANIPHSPAPSKFERF